MNIAQRIRQARRRAGFSQQALANVVGVQRSAVSNWESASNVQPAIANLAAIAVATQVSFEWLATGRGPLALGHDALLDVSTADAELVELPAERELLKIYRALPHRAQVLFVELGEMLVTARRAKRRH